MSRGVTNGLVLLAGLAVLVAVLDLAGCFAGKISASRAVEILKNGEPSWKRVVCQPYKRGYWDYTCRVSSRRVNGSFSFLVKANGSGIVDQSAP